MKTSTLVAVFVAVVVVLGGGYVVWSKNQPASTTEDMSGMQEGTPMGAAGINGSNNQGNVGQPDSGTPQQPDSGTAGKNMILGVGSNATLGSFLTASNGMTLYTYTKDRAAISNCSGNCAVNWPPYTVFSVNDVHLPSNLTGKVDTIKRADGSLQVTYNNAPLYFYKADTKPGDTLGQNVGGVWFIAKQ